MVSDAAQVTGGNGTSNLPSHGVPDSNVSIQAPSRHPLAVKCNSINLAKMSLQCLQASSLGDAPNSGKRIVASRYYNVALDL